MDKFLPLTPRVPGGPGKPRPGRPTENGRDMLIQLKKTIKNDRPLRVNYCIYKLMFPQSSASVFHQSKLLELIKLLGHSPLMRRLLTG